MIAWWGWLIIWLALALLMLAVLALFAWRLFRKFLGVLDDLSDLTDQVDVLVGLDMQPQLPTPALAVLADLRDIRAREEDRIAHRQRRRDDRHERRMSRAFIIGSVDVTRTQWPAAWYGRRTRTRKRR